MQRLSHLYLQLVCATLTELLEAAQSVREDTAAN